MKWLRLLLALTFSACVSIACAQTPDATYIPSQGKVVLPRLWVGSKLYYVVLTSKGGLEFGVQPASVTDLALLPGYVPAAASDLVGRWNLNGSVVMFTANGTYSVNQPANNGCKAGIETGSYQYDSSTGVMTFLALADTNGSCGFSHTNGSPMRWRKTNDSIGFIQRQADGVLAETDLQRTNSTFSQFALKFRALGLKSTPAAPGPQIAYGGSITSRACDVNGDTLIDIILGAGNHPGAGQNQAASLRVLLNKGDTTFYEDDPGIAKGLLPKMTHPRIMECADFNNDGRADLYVAGHGWDAAPYPGEINALLLSVAGKWNDRSATLPPIPDFSHSMAVGDIDGDGDLDIYVGNLNSQTAIGPYFLINDGAGNFTKDASRLAAGVTNFDTQSLAAALIDVDGDNRPELMLATYAQYASKIYQNDGKGNFQQLAARQLPAPPASPLNGTQIFGMSILAYDVNGDGRQDALISYTNPDQGNGGTVIQLLLNDGAAGFVDKTQDYFQGSQTHSFPDWMEFLRAVDINNDGAIDLLAENTRGQRGSANVNTPFLWLNDGNGHYLPVTRPMLGLQPAPSETYAIDVNGDGAPDLVQASVPYTTGWPTYEVFLNETYK